MPKQKKRSRIRRTSSPDRFVTLGTLRGSGVRTNRVALAGELLSTCAIALKAYGLKKSEIMKLSKCLCARTGQKGASSRILAATHQLSDLIATWGDDPGYLDPGGKPAVLRIHGGDRDFTSLAKQFFPRCSAKEVLRFACETKAVEHVGKDRVARLNDYVGFSGNSILIFANAVQTIRRYLSTANFNRQKKIARAVHLGRADRTSASLASEADITEYLRVMRLQLSDMVETSTRWLVRRSSAKPASRSKRKTVGLQAFLFVE